MGRVGIRVPTTQLTRICISLPTSSLPFPPFPLPFCLPFLRFRPPSHQPSPLFPISPLPPPPPHPFPTHPPFTLHPFPPSLAPLPPTLHLRHLIQAGGEGADGQRDVGVGADSVVLCSNLDTRWVRGGGGEEGLVCLIIFVLCLPSSAVCCVLGACVMQAHYNSQHHNKGYQRSSPALPLTASAATTPSGPASRGVGAAGGGPTARPTSRLRVRPGCVWGGVREGSIAREGREGVGGR